jgi:hypothetical protein
MSGDRIQGTNYDRGITPAETAARMEREGEDFKHKPQQNSEEDIDTTSGYTMDKEGLVNNFAVEPEMYYEEPGDLKAKEEAEKEARHQELAEVNDTDEEGELTMDRDDRGKGTGVI